MSKKSWSIFAAVCLVVLGGLIYLSNRSRIDVSAVNNDSILKASTQSGNIADHVFGVQNSKVVLYEYGDYECPSCGAAYQPLKDITAKYQGQISFVFRNFPLVTIHPNARAGAAAAEAAGLQGKYWQMHDLLYENQTVWGQADPNSRGSYFDSYAKQLGLNIATFDTDMSSAAVDQKISFDIALGQKLNVDATPTIYLGSTRLDNISTSTSPVDETKLSALIDAQLRANNIALPTTTSNTANQ